MNKIILTVLASISIIVPRLTEVEAEEPIPDTVDVVKLSESTLTKEREEYEYNKLSNRAKREIDKAYKAKRKKDAKEKAEKERLEKKALEKKKAQEAARVEAERILEEAIIEVAVKEAEPEPVVVTKESPAPPQEIGVAQAPPVETKSGGAQSVKFTNYYTGDATGATDRTAVGLTANDFGVNHRGWYTYNGDVVLAGATNACLDITSGPCGEYSYLPAGFRSYDFYDRVAFDFQGEAFSGVIVDSCGACFWDEQYQRMDIYVAPGGQFGTQIGEIHH